MTGSSDRARDRRTKMALGLGVLLLSGCAAASMWLGAAAGFAAYLPALLAWAGLAIGALFILLINGLAGGRWGAELRPALIPMAATLPLVALLFVPMVFGIADVYPWAVGAEGSERHGFRAAWLDVQWMTVRLAAFFVVWIVTALAAGVPMWPGSRRRRAGTTGLGLVTIVFVIAMTMFAVDWIMSLDPHWYSTMIGFVVFATTLAGALAAALFARARGAAGRHTTGEPLKRLHDVGNLLLAASMLWIYITFMQFLIIWSGNLPEEIRWYVARSGPGWRGVGFAALLLVFVVPMATLISRRIKRSPSALSAVAAAVFIGYVLHVYWLVGEPLVAPHPAAVWLVAPVFVGVGALWLSWASWPAWNRMEQALDGGEDRP